jgi:pimeloyl-ACP methyl ester carboxylesterase
MPVKDITIAEQSFTYLDEGEGPTLVLLPGWNEDHRMYKRLAPALKRDFRVVGLNWRGHGEKRELSGDFDIPQMAADVVALVEQLDLQPEALVSFSHGGWISLEAAQQLGVAKAPRLALLSFKLNDPGPALETWCRQWQDDATWQEARQGFFDYARGSSDSADIIDHITNEMSTYGREYWRRTGREMWASYEKWGTPFHRLEALDPSRPVMHVYTLPHDQAYTDEQEEFARRNPWFQPVRLPGETHFPLLESPAAVARLIKEFVGGAS